MVDRPLPIRRAEVRSWPITFARDTPNVSWANDAITRIEVSAPPRSGPAWPSALIALQPAGQADHPTWKAMWPCSITPRAWSPPSRRRRRSRSSCASSRSRRRWRATLRNAVADANAADSGAAEVDRRAGGRARAPSGRVCDPTSRPCSPTPTNEQRARRRGEERAKLAAQRDNAKLEVWMALPSPASGSSAAASATGPSPTGCRTTGCPRCGAATT